MIVEKYTQILSDLLKVKVKFEYFISFGNVHPLEWRRLSDNELTRSKDDTNGLLIVISTDNNKEESIGSFKLLQMPGCCGICISTAASVQYNYRRKGINTILNKMRIEIATYCEYTVLMCTDVITNIAERKTLQNNGWKDILQFNNKRTGNNVALSIYNLIQ